MSLTQLSTLLILGLALVPSDSKSEPIDFWKLGNIPLGGTCASGYNPGPGIIPGFEDIDDWWFLNIHCDTFQGSAGCINNTCVCNQEDDAYPVGVDPDVLCLGKVGAGAYCTAEHSSIFPDKHCTPNADCVPEQGEGRAVGRCRCLYGYKATDEGLCEVDDSIGEGDRSTPRTTTTTQPPKREQLKLPLGLLLANTVVGFEETCMPKGTLLNHTYCDTYTRTVSCQSSKCLCNMEEDSIFDEELNMCVGLVGTYCLGRRTLLGYKACTKYADCELEKKSLEEYSFGSCQCAYGYKETANRRCERDENIKNPSTQQTIVPIPTLPTTTERSHNPGIGTGNNAAVSKLPTIEISLVVTIISIVLRMMMH